MKTNQLFITSSIFMLFFYAATIYLPEAGRERKPDNKDGTKHKQKTSNSAKQKHQYTDPLQDTYFADLLPSYSSPAATILFTKQEQNNAPVVQILSPENDALVEPNALIRYTICVSDKEDGSSQYQEIASNEVFLEVTYLPDASKAADYISENARQTMDHPGLAVIRTSDCFNCHAVKSKLQGPSFSEIARRYPQNAMSAETLSMRIVKGNSGVWGDATMPPHPDITQEQAKKIVHWILENAGDANRNYYAGLEGTFRTKARSAGEANGVYMLTASYTDHGLQDMPQLKRRGQHTVMLRTK